MKLERILVVDDEEICRFIVSVTFGLVSPSTQIVEAESGPQALNLLSTEPPFDLILLDINMPGTNGFEFLDALQHVQDKTQIAVPPVVMLTSSMFPLDKIIAEQYPAVKAYLTKPFTEESARLLMNLNVEDKTQVL